MRWSRRRRPLPRPQKVLLKAGAAAPQQSSAPYARRAGSEARQLEQGKATRDNFSTYRWRLWKNTMLFAMLAAREMLNISG